MSLVKLLTTPVKIFQKHVIAFLVVRRHDLNLTEDLIRYISLKPNTSIRSLRQKIWKLLDLPDYCDEIIILKTSDNVEIPLTALRKGNEPNRPFILEVWMPIKSLESMTSVRNHMLTMGRGDDDDDNLTTRTSQCSCLNAPITKDSNCLFSTKTDNFTMHKLQVVENARMTKTDLAARISNSSFILKLQGRKSRDNVTDILVKIQNDLSTLSNKLSNLENRVPT